MEQIRTFKGGLNTDDSVEILSPDDYQYAYNVVSGRSYLSQNGNQELIKGTTALDSNIELYEELFGSALGDWTNVGSGETWAWNASGSGAALVQFVTAGGAINSKYLTKDYNTYTGVEYSLDVNASLLDWVTGTGSGLIKVYFSNGTLRDLAFSLAFDENDASATATQTFTALNDYDKIEIYVELTTSSNPAEVNIYIGSHSLTRVLPLDSNSTCIGVIRSVKDDLHYLFFHNTTAAKNCILKLDNDVLSNVITWSGLNFSTSYRINGGGIAGDLLLFTDGYNEPRCLNVSTHVDSPPSTEEEILLIKRGPQIPPTFEKFLLDKTETGTEYTISSTTPSTIVCVEDINVGTPQVGGFVHDGIEYTYTSWASKTFSGVSPSPSGLTGTITAVSQIEADLVNDSNFQFAYHYEYDDKQVSVLSPFSKLCSRSVVNQDYRRVRITVPANEDIPVLVDKIVISARVENSGSFFEIGRLTKTAGVFATKYLDFYNTTNGNSLDPFLNLQYSLVPRKAGTMTLAKNRAWLGDILEGYDTPESIDLSVSISAQYDGEDPIYQVYKLRRNIYEYSDLDGGVWVLQYIVYLTIGTSEYLVLRGDYFDSIVFNPATWDGVSSLTIDQPDNLVYDYPAVGDIFLNGSTLTYYEHEFVPYTSGGNYVYVPIDNSTPAADLEGLRTFPSDSSYKLGIIFKDANGRNCGVYTKDDLIISTSRKQANYINFNWSLESNTGIPSWAKYYSIVMTKNLSKSYYIEAYGCNVFYRKILSNGDNSDTYVNTNITQYPYVVIDVRNFLPNGISYTFIDGDRVLLRKVGGTTSSYDLRIKSFDGSFITCWRDEMDVTVTQDVKSVLEIYRPITDRGFDVVFYEIGETYKIQVSGDNSLSFSVNSGLLEGDSTIVARDVYDYSAGELVDTDSDIASKSIAVNDILLRYGDAELPLLSDNIAQTPQKVSSLNIINNTLNDLRKKREKKKGRIKAAIDKILGNPDPLAEPIEPFIESPNLYPVENFEMLVWNTDIGRPFIQLTVGETQKESYFRHSGTFVAGTSLNFLSDFDAGDEGNIPIESGKIQKLQSTSKESTEGDVILAIASSDTFSVYIDESRLNTGRDSVMVGSTKVIGDVRKQKSGFGTLHPESVHEEDGYVYWYDKLSRSYCRYSSNGVFPISEYKMVNHFEKQSQLNTDANIVITGYDPFYKAIFVTFENAASSDRKTIAYSLVKERWISFYGFVPDSYVVGSDALYSIKDGGVYKHSDTTNFNRFYGVDYNGVISCSFNESPELPKEWRAVALGVSPSFYQFSSGDQSVITNGLKVDISNMHGQATDIRHDEFEVDENMVYGEIMGDTNTGTLLTGDQIYSNTMQSQITMIYGTYKYLIYAKAGFEISQGHQL